MQPPEPPLSLTYQAPLLDLAVRKIDRPVVETSSETWRAPAAWQALCLTSCESVLLPKEISLTARLAEPPAMPSQIWLIV